MRLSAVAVFRARGRSQQASALASLRRPGAHARMPIRRPRGQADFGRSLGPSGDAVKTHGMFALPSCAAYPIRTSTPHRSHRPGALHTGVCP